MTAKYRVTTKIDAGNRPILLITVRKESQLVLDTTRLDDLKRIVNSKREGPDRLSGEDGDYWLDTISDLQVLIGRLSETPTPVRLGLKSRWRPLPQKLLTSILDDYSVKKNDTLNIYVEGGLPNTSVVFNVGAASFKVPLPPSEVPTAEKELNNLQAVVAEAKKEGKTNEETAEVVEAIKDTAFATTSVTVCTITLAGAIASGGLDIPYAVLTCGDAVNNIKNMMERWQKDQKDRDQIDQDFDRIDSCPVDGSDINWDKVDVISRTA